MLNSPAVKNYPFVVQNKQLFDMIKAAGLLPEAFESIKDSKAIEKLTDTSAEHIAKTVAKTKSFKKTRKSEITFGRDLHRSNPTFSDFIGLNRELHNDKKFVKTKSFDQDVKFMQAFWTDYQRLLTEFTNPRMRL